MKKRTTKTTDLLDSELDFSLLGAVRRNAFSGSGERGGPSLLALWEMPELPAGTMLLRRGRPVKGTGQTTVVRSVRLPSKIWDDVEKKARSKHLNVHQAMRAALIGWLRRTG